MVRGTFSPARAWHPAVVARLARTLAMLDFLHTLSLESGALLVGLVSAPLSVVWSRLNSQKLGWFLVLLTPLVVSYSLYWSPVWLGDSASEYSSWSGLFIGPWFVTGAIASAVVMYLIGKRKAVGHVAKHG